MTKNRTTPSQRLRRLVHAWLAVVVCVGITTGCRISDSSGRSASNYYVYISLSGDEEIAIYKMIPETGELIPSGNVNTGGTPGSIAVSPSNTHLYAAIRSTASVTSFLVHPETGGLSSIGMTPVVDNPVYVTTDKTGKFLLTAYYGAGKAAVFPIVDGVIGSEPTDIQAAEQNPHSILADPSNTFTFVPNTGADSILQYRLDLSSGKLLSNTTPKIATQPGSGPRHVWFHPRLPVVYFVNEKNSSVSVFQLNRDTGTLSSIQTLPTLPPDFTGDNTCADIEVTPSGCFLYASNRGHNSIACYSIDQESGQLTSLGQAPTEKRPRSFNVDPTGQYLFAAGQDSGRLQSYRIDPVTGKLQKLQLYNVGQTPSWVQVVEMPPRRQTPSGSD